MPFLIGEKPAQSTWSAATGAGAGDSFGRYPPVRAKPGTTRQVGALAPPRPRGPRRVLCPVKAWIGRLRCSRSRPALATSWPLVVPESPAGTPAILPLSTDQTGAAQTADSDAARRWNEDYLIFSGSSRWRSAPDHANLTPCSSATSVMADACRWSGISTRQISTRRRRHVLKSRQFCTAAARRKRPAGADLAESAPVQAGPDAEPVNRVNDLFCAKPASEAGDDSRIPTLWPS